MSKRSRAPAHQNTFAFVHNKGSKKTAKILAMPNQGLCRRCHEQIEWRKRYRKYKPLKAPGKCNGCGQRRVTRAYHKLCDPCAESKALCGKCQQPNAIVAPVITEEQLAAQQREEERAVRNMRERERRSYLRQQERRMREEEEDEEEDEEEEDEEEEGECFDEEEEGEGGDGKEDKEEGGEDKAEQE